MEEDHVICEIRSKNERLFSRLSRLINENVDDETDVNMIKSLRLDRREDDKIKFEEHEQILGRPKDTKRMENSRERMFNKFKNDIACIQQQDYKLPSEYGGAERRTQRTIEDEFTRNNEDREPEKGTFERNLIDKLKKQEKEISCLQQQIVHNMERNRENCEKNNSDSIKMHQEIVMLKEEVKTLELKVKNEQNEKQQLSIDNSKLKKRLQDEVIKKNKEIKTIKSLCKKLIIKIIIYKRDLDESIAKNEFLKSLNSSIQQNLTNSEYEKFERSKDEITDTNFLLTKEENDTTLQLINCKFENKRFYQKENKFVSKKRIKKYFLLALFISRLVLIVQNRHRSERRILKICKKLV